MNEDSDRNAPASIPPSPLDDEDREMLAVLRALTPYQKRLAQRLIKEYPNWPVGKLEALTEQVARATSDQATTLIADYLGAAGN